MPVTEKPINDMIRYPEFPVYVATMTNVILTDILRSLPPAEEPIFGRHSGDGWVFRDAGGKANHVTVDGDFYAVELSFARKTYAYRAGETLLWLAFAVLFCHFLMAWIQLLLLVIGETWHSRGWGELEELLALALVTPATRIDRKEGWGYKASVRSTQGSVRLAVKH